MTERLEKLFSEMQDILEGIRADNLDSQRRAEILAKDVWNVKELALYLHRSVDRVSRMAKERRFPSYKQGGAYYFRRGEIEDWLTSNRIDSLDEIKSKAELQHLKLKH